MSDASAVPPADPRAVPGAAPTTAPAAGPADTSPVDPDAPPSWLADPERVAEHERWLLELTGLPTAAGREEHVVAWIEAWTRERDLTLERDAHGNLSITGAGGEDGPPLVLQAHLDHPAFVVEDVAEDGSLDLTFRGGVRDPYFVGARIVLLTGDGRRHGAVVTASERLEPLRRCRAELDDASAEVPPGSIGVWELEAPSIEDGVLHAPAVDDLAGLAAALAAVDACRQRGTSRDVRLFLTRAEEIGFVGTVAACESRSLPEGVDLVTLETSRSFADSPIGGGPIVRVGDRVSTFDPGLTALAGEVAASIAGEHEDFRWQRRLMAGGACEATMFVRSGYRATCLCLPLGNYHNMSELDRVEREAPERATIARELIAVRDFHGLVRLLVGMAESTPGGDPVRERLIRRYQSLRWVLER